MRTNDIDDTAIAGPLFACHQLIATFMGLQLCLGASSHQKSEVTYRVVKTICYSRIYERQEKLSSLNSGRSVVGGWNVDVADHIITLSRYEAGDEGEKAQC